MKRYSFALESVLRARRAQEGLARQRLAEANHRVLAARAAQDACLVRYRAMTPTAGVTAPGTFLAERAHEERVAEMVSGARRVTREAEVEAATCFAVWIEARKQVASLERLDERRRGEWQAELLREEATAVDDVVASRWQPTDHAVGLGSGTGRRRQGAGS